MVECGQVNPHDQDLVTVWVPKIRSWVLSS
jgi:hypothetical protein